MAITLPTGKAGLRAVPQLVPAAGLSRSVGAQNLNAVTWHGRHWLFPFYLPAMSQAAALDWSDLEEDAATLVLEIPQGDLQPANEGAPRVKGAGQLGASLEVDGVTASYVVKKGAFISIIINGRRYVYRVKAEATSNGATEVTLSLRPSIRVPPPDNAVVEIAAPKVEGFVLSMSHTLAALYQGGGATFDIEERG